MLINALMKTPGTNVLLCFLIAGLLVACDDGVEKPNPPVLEGELSILPLGDSRVEGARPVYESYRYELWKNLVEGNYDIDFVGPERDDASYPEFMGLRFDEDHAGIGGDRTTDVLRRLEEVLENVPEPPQVVLLGIGGNDLLGGSTVGAVIDNINQIIDRLQQENPSVLILVEQIAPGRSNFMNTQSEADFREFQQDIASLVVSQTEGDSRVVAVDMYSDWRDAYLADVVHYNEAGAREVADRYFAVLQENLAR